MGDLTLRCLDVDTGSTNLLHNITLRIVPGVPMGLVGPSGSGKTMLARTMLGLLPHGVQLSYGEMWMNGERINPGDREGMVPVRGRRIGYMLQHPHLALDPVSRVGDQMKGTLRDHAMADNQRECESQVLSWLNRMDFDEPELVARMYPFQLSGGMARRVYLAMVLMLEPELLIADEPTAGLDGVTAGTVLRLIRRETRERSLLLITHDVRILSPETDAMAVMVGGEIVEIGPVRQLIKAPEHPYTQGMMSAVKGAIDEPLNGWERNGRDGYCGYRHVCPSRLNICDEKPVPLVERNEGWVRCHRCF